MFNIVIKKPSILGGYDSEDISVSEAIYSIYPIGDGCIELNWNGCVIELSLNSLSDFFSDIIDMLKSLLIAEPFVQYFLCSSFTAEWDIKFKGELLEISPKWIAVVFSGERPCDNQVTDKLAVSRNHFINEWNGLLRIIKNDLIGIGYTNNLEGFDYLNTL